MIEYPKGNPEVYCFAKTIPVHHRGYIGNASDVEVKLDCYSEDIGWYKMYVQRKDIKIDRSKKMDVGKNPFKKFYELGITVEDLPQHTYKNRLVEFIKSVCNEENNPNFHILPNTLYFLWPNIDTENKGFIYVWPNADARMKGAKGRQAVKPGKALRILFPKATDVEIEWWVNQIKDNFFSEEVFTFHQGKNAEDFLKAYTGERANDRFFHTTCKNKRMSDSCMRYPRNHFSTKTHPVEAYATGDWTIFWTENKYGEICSRCIAYESEGKYELGPIYSTSRQAINAMEGELGKLNTTEVGEGNWEEARIHMIQEGGKYVGPYFDNALTMREDGEYFVIDSSGSIEHGSEGYIGAGDMCNLCGDYNLDVVYYENIDRYACRCCFEYDTFLSDHSGERFLLSGVTEVLTERRTEEWDESEAESYAIYSEKLDGYIEDGFSLETYDEDYIPKNWVATGDWFICAVSRLAYPIDEGVQTEDGMVAKENMEDVA